MNSSQVYQQIIDAIEKATQNSTKEPQIVKEAINQINNISFPGNIKKQTGFCHQKPYALFVNPDNIYSFKRTELGDLMFVVKVITNNITVDYRSLFFQAKYDKDFQNFTIEKHQQYFYSQINKIDFKFGNKVYDNLNIKPIIWSNLSTPENFGDYLLIGDNHALDISLKSINNQYDPIGKKFKFDLHNYFSTMHRYFPFSNCCSLPLLDFLSPFGKGNKITGLFEIFTELIYKKLGMIIDPPEEHQGFWEEDEKGFGVIEITYFEE